MKSIGTFNLGAGISIDVGAEKNKIELNVKMMGQSIKKVTQTPDEAEKLGALIDWAVVEARKP